MGAFLQPLPGLRPTGNGVLFSQKRQDLLPLSTWRSLCLEGQLLPWDMRESAASLGQTLGGANSLALNNPFQQSPAVTSRCQQDKGTKGSTEDGMEEPVRPPALL